jgi:hypothetical protein
MSCLALLLLTAVIIYFGAAISFFLAAGMVPLAILSLVLIPLALLFTWRIIYPWLVRMGRWSAQFKNLIFLALVLTAVGIGLGYIINVPIVTIPLLRIEVPVTLLIFLPIFLFLLLLGIVVWLVRIWRRGWPLGRNFFWDILFRIVALFWKILRGIPIGIVWFFYHPPLRWLVAAVVFYLRGISAAVAWLLYNPPLRSITIVILFVTRLIGRVVAAILYNPPILWLIQFGLFILRLIARFNSTIIYGIWSWWPVKGVKERLEKGLTVESKSYQDYKYAQNDGSGAA